MIHSPFFEKHGEAIDKWQQSTGQIHLIYELYKTARFFRLSAATVWMLLGEDMMSRTSFYYKLKKGQNVALTDFEEQTRKKVARVVSVINMLRSGKIDLQKYKSPKKAYAHIMGQIKEVADDDTA